MSNVDRNIIIFGAGAIGRMALLKYRNRVDYFIDNDEERQGQQIEGLEIKKVVDCIQDLNTHTVVIASRSEAAMAKQLEDLGVEKGRYFFYITDPREIYKTEELIFNVYLDNDKRNLSELDWNKEVARKHIIEEINTAVEDIYGKNKIFSHVEIETINRCNGNCSFCPVSRDRDPREYKVMPADLFQSIINQLAELNYSGSLALFSNNEPLLDPDIIKRHQYARAQLPNARMHLYTNGTLLTIEVFEQLIKYLDELVIDNYHPDLHLIKPCCEIAEYCETHPELKKKVTIVLRNPQEILTSRGGDAPNRKELISYGRERCILPFKQLIIRPDGKISLCCNDALGSDTLGDLTQESVLDAWNNKQFQTVRKALYEGRANWKHCVYCDNFSL